MLQYFINGKYKSIFVEGYVPKVEYVCKIDELSSKIPRAMHLHNNLVEILLVYEGTGTHIIDKQRYKTVKGDLIFYNSNVIHDEIVESGSNWGTYCIGISNLRLTGLSLNKIIPDDYYPVIASEEYFGEILDIFKSLEQKAKLASDLNVEYINCLARVLILKIYMIISAYNNPLYFEVESLATKVKNYIDEHYKEDLTLERLAEAVKANKYYLAHVFKEETGFSPIKYVMRRRLGEAQNLLISTQWSITKIATMVGYNDSNYFQKVFHKNVGLTPGHYRRHWKK